MVVCVCFIPIQDFLPAKQTVTRQVDQTKTSFSVLVMILV